MTLSDEVLEFTVQVERILPYEMNVNKIFTLSTSVERLLSIENSAALVTSQEVFVNKDIYVDTWVNREMEWELEL